MRISDWSSDVCSSDLIGFGADGAEGLPVDGGSVGFVAMGHQGLPKRARTCRAVRPVFSGGAPARALRDRSKRPCRPVRTRLAVLWRAQPMAPAIGRAPV